MDRPSNEAVIPREEVVTVNDFKNGADGGAPHLPGWQLLERTAVLGDNERDVIELSSDGELLDLFHNRSD